MKDYAADCYYCSFVFDQLYSYRTEITTIAVNMNNNFVHYVYNLCIRPVAQPPRENHRQSSRDVKYFWDDCDGFSSYIMVKLFFVL